ncbi:MAG: winged helix-turn-helix domain-containing protein [Tahibacter sp.]
MDAPHSELPRANILRIGEHRIDVGALRLLDANETPRLTPKAVAVLLELAAQPGVTVSREELLLRVWGERNPSDDVLTQAIRELRRAFGDEVSTPRHIETVPRLGYRLLAKALWEIPQPATQDRSPTRPPATTPARERQRLIATAASIVAFAIIGIIVQVSNQKRRELDHYRATATLVLTADPGAELLPHVSPDGSRVAYVAVDQGTHRRRVHVRSTSGSAVLLPTTGNGDEAWPIWADDGASLAFLRHEQGTCHLLTVPALGGNERVRSDCSSSLFDGFDWSPDGTEFAVAILGRERGRTAQLARRSVDGGEPLEFVYSHNPQEHDFSPRYSPDGRWIAFRRGLVPFCDLYVVDTRGGDVRALTHVASRIRGFDWLADSQGLVFASDHEGSSGLYVVDANTGQLSNLHTSPAQYPDSARRANSVVYEIPKFRAMMAGVVLDRVDAPTADLAASTGSDSHPALSPDGTRVAFVSDRSGSLQVWLFDAAEQQSWPLTDEPRSVYLYPEWRSDGRRLLVTRRRAGSGSVIEIDVGSHVLREIDANGLDVRYATYAPGDESYLVLAHSSTSTDLVRLDAARNSRSAQLLAANVAAVQCDSSDKQVYFSRIDAPGLYVVGLEGGDARPVDDGDSIDTRFAWRVAAHSLWYLEATADDRIVLKRRRLDNGDVSLQWQPSIEIDHTYFSIARDGHRVVVSTATRNDTDIGLLRILRSVDE